MSTMSILVLGLLAGTAIGWEYMYECDDWPTLCGWELVTGADTDFEITQDPDNPENNILHIMSFDVTGVDDPSSFVGGRPNVRLQYNWDADGSGVTAEIRMRETAGGVFVEVFDGGVRQLSMETKPPYDFFDWAFRRKVDNVFLEEWNVIRMAYDEGGYRFYCNGELALDGTAEAEGGPYVADAGGPTNRIRVGHSKNSGPLEGRADIWVDYIYFDTSGAFGVGEEPWETAVEAETWAKIKAQF